MKNILKAFGLGILFGILSYCAFAFGTMAVEAFIDMVSAVGLNAIGLTFAGLLLGFMSVFLIFVMGAVPLSTVEELKELKAKLKEKEEND